MSISSSGDDSTRFRDNAIDHRIDRVLNKYASVWVWSVLIGVSTGSEVTFLLAAKPFRWKGAGLVLAGFAGLGAMLSLMALYSLLRYLTGVLLPMFSKSLDDVEVNELNRKGFYLLAGALRFQLIAILMGILVILSEYLLGALAD